MTTQQSIQDAEQRKREFSALRKYAAIQKSQEDKVCVQKAYIDITGDIEAAFVLDELLFFTLPRPETGRSGLRVWKEGFLWMAVGREDWWERKRLTARQADLATDKLIEKKLVFKEVHKFNGLNTVHLRLNVEEFFKAYTKVLEKENPPESGEDTIIKDIADLYEMMGESRLPNGELPNGDGRLPNGEMVSPNGDFLNSPNTSLTQPPDVSLSPEEIEQVNKKVDKILELNKKSSSFWKGRDSFRDNHLVFADWYNEKTGQICGKKNQRAWQKAFSDWQSEELTLESLEAARQARLKWKEFISDPNELTKDAVAIQAIKLVKPQTIEYKKVVADENDEKGVPNPFGRPKGVRPIIRPDRARSQSTVE